MPGQAALAGRRRRHRGAPCRRTEIVGVTRKKLIAWGASGQALVIEEFLSERGFELIALLDTEPARTSPFRSVPIFTGPQALDHWLSTGPHGDVHFIVAIGGEHGSERCAIAARLRAAGLVAATLVHPTAFVATSVRLGAGSVVLAQAAVGVRSELGECVIVNTAASVDHECVLGPGVHIGPGARVAGCVVVGGGTFVASGATIAPRVRIGSESIVGAGAVVVRDLPAGVVAYGNPARIVRRRLSSRSA
jgi:sugar O-acyltransferase (sialic acid O-acetyltransferase NeuD family)